MKPFPYFILFLFALPLYAEEPRTVRLTLSPETTFLTEPQLPDGRIDYIAALNKKLAAQTTPENNLLVGINSLIPGEWEMALIRAQNTGELERAHAEVLERTRRHREQFWKMLGADMPPLDSLVAADPTYSLSPTEDYEKKLLKFYTREELAPMIERQREREKNRQQSRLDAGTITQEEYEAAIKRIETEIPDWYYRQIIADQWMESLGRPWTAEDYPYLAHWIASTDDLTIKLIDISRQRTGYYHPLIAETPFVFYVSLPYVQSHRVVARFFRLRGNFEFAHGRFDQAMECSFSAIRMAQTIRSHSGSFVEYLVGIAMTGMGNYQLTTHLASLPTEKDATWILQKKKEYDAMVTEFGQLPFPPILRLAGRFDTLSFVQSLAVEPLVALELFEPGDFGEEGFAKYEKLFTSDIEYDWDEIMRRVNLYHDDWDDVVLTPSWQRRLRATTRLTQRVMEDGKRSTASDEISERAATDFLLGHLAPLHETVQWASARIEWDSRVTSVAFALAAYRADNEGESPDSLEQLIPKYLDKVPTSPFTDQPLRYIKRENDVLIANDDTFLLDGSEEDVERLIADAKPGVRVFPTAQSFVLVVSKR